MMLALLTQTFGSVEWLNSSDPSAILRTTGKATGKFVVDSAPEMTDARGRHVIAAQDFVKAEGVQSVFGLIGGFINGSFCVWLTFTREKLPTDRVADSLLPALALFRAKTARLIRTQQVFDGQTRLAA